MEISLCDYISDLQKQSNKASGTTAKIIQGRIVDAREMFNVFIADNRDKKHNVPYPLDVSMN